MNDNQPENVTVMGVVTSHDVPADRILTSAIGQLDGVVIAGYDKDGNEYFASSYASGGDALWLIERLKMTLLGQID